MEILHSFLQCRVAPGPAPVLATGLQPARPHTPVLPGSDQPAVQHQTAAVAAAQQQHRPALQHQHAAVAAAQQQHQSAAGKTAIVQQQQKQKQLSAQENKAQPV